MPRVDLSVPYEEKDAAKMLGAKWDTASKIWFVPEGIDAEPFKKWLPIPPKKEPNSRCNRFFIALASHKCPKCSASTKMIAIVLPSGWDELINPENGEKNYWRRSEHDTMLHRVTYMNDETFEAMKKISANYKLVPTSGYLSQKYMNICESCNAQQQEPGSDGKHALQPETIEKANKITLHYFNQPVEAWSGYHDPIECHGGLNAFDHMQKVSNAD